MKNIHRLQKGFTLVEVLVVVGILSILLAITIIALNPAKHFQDSRNTQRSSDVSAILNAIYQYQAANKGTLPPTLSAVTTTPVALATGVGNASTCADLSPTYIADLPLDPSTGTKTPTTGSTCSATSYNTGYTVAKSAAGNRFTIAAPAAEGGVTISITR